MTDIFSRQVALLNLEPIHYFAFTFSKTEFYNSDLNSILPTSLGFEQAQTFVCLD